jgi:hypothetical protein
MSKSDFDPSKVDLSRIKLASQERGSSPAPVAG